jgi:MoaA/NifB/PqqE/SkfB family radical SAM enzyme
VTVTMNAVDPDIGALIYRSVRLDDISYVGAAGAAVLLSNQLAGIRRLVRLGVIVKVNCVLIAGINETHVRAVAEKAAALGASVQNIMQMIPVPGSAFGELPQVSLKTLQKVRASCEDILPQMLHCHQCRADAAGTLDDDRSYLLDDEHISHGTSDEPPLPGLAIRVAVASHSGIMVDQHFGHAEKFLIYETDGSSARYVASRAVERYCQGGEDCDESDDHTDRALAALEDCRAVLSLRIGRTPAMALNERGIASIVTCDSITVAVKEAARDILAPSSLSEHSAAAVGV